MSFGLLVRERVAPPAIAGFCMGNFGVTANSGYMSKSLQDFCEKNGLPAVHFVAISVLSNCTYTATEDLLKQSGIPVMEDKKDNNGLHQANYLRPAAAITLGIAVTTAAFCAAAKANLIRPSSLPGVAGIALASMTTQVCFKNIIGALFAEEINPSPPPASN